eukprot:NODE_6737_length_1643_cov_5.357520.p1 GENE.NODE_6737_length_1643_cov_5.357520~~NODE_6737_length_1643_cov_5.357520.p1  ORF type:complete len:491 (+),score=74.26 NODE_6737_length_1643_cov_5.357520:84-1556(+)
MNYQVEVEPVSVPWRCLVPEAVATCLLEHSGAGLHELGEASGAELSVADALEKPEALADSIVRLRGPAECKELACRWLLLKHREVRGVPDREACAFVVLAPATAAPALQGAARVRLRSAALHCGAKVSVSRECILDTFHLPVRICGGTCQVVAAVTAFYALLEDLADKGQLARADFDQSDVVVKSNLAAAHVFATGEQLVCSGADQPDSSHAGAYSASSDHGADSCDKSTLEEFPSDVAVDVEMNSAAGSNRQMLAAEENVCSPRARAFMHEQIHPSPGLQEVSTPGFGSRGGAMASKAGPNPQNLQQWFSLSPDLTFTAQSKSAPPELNLVDADSPTAAMPRIPQHGIDLGVGLGPRLWHFGTAEADTSKPGTEAWASCSAVSVSSTAGTSLGGWNNCAASHECALLAGLVAPFTVLAQLRLLLPEVLFHSVGPVGMMGEIACRTGSKINIGSEGPAGMRQVTLHGPMLANALAALYLQEVMAEFQQTL